jgi:hypothetical protein
VGAELDDPALETVLTELGFNVSVERSKSAAEMMRLLGEFAADDRHNSVDCAVVSIMSHGEDNKYYGTDGMYITYQNVYHMFGHQGCPQLRGKPKIFLMKACRGSHLHIGVPYQRRTGIDGHPECFTDELETAYKDIFTFFSTLEGLVSLREVDKGTWFIDTIVNVFRENAWKDNFHDLCNEVNRRMERLTSMSGDKQSAQYTHSGHVRTLFFNPGL